MMKGKVLLDLRDGYPARPKVAVAVAVETLARQIDETHARWDQLEAWPTPSQPRPPST